MSEELKAAEAVLRAKLELDGQTGCLVWTGSRSTKGYGRIHYRGRRAFAHRVAYELARGPIPHELVLDHLCRNRLCCNPDHLEVVTPKENVLRGIGTTAFHARQTHCRRGHALTADNVYVRPDGTGRECLICNRRRRADSYSKQRAAKEDIDWKARCRAADALIARLEAQVSGLVATAEDAQRERDRAIYSQSPFSTWRGACGHVWDRGVEDTAECPRCALVLRVETADRERDEWKEYALDLAEQFKSVKADLSRAVEALGNIRDNSNGWQRDTANDYLSEKWEEANCLSVAGVQAGLRPTDEPHAAGEGGPGYDAGSVLWHCSEEDSGPDCGISVGLGAGMSLYCGELADVTLADHGIADQCCGSGWWLVLYGPGHETIIGAVADIYQAQEALEAICGRVQGLLAAQSSKAQSTSPSEASACTLPPDELNPSPPPHIKQEG